ncbi:tetratricopeptide repeat protein [Streptomyces shenzhenensis]|uniref:Tetratricopeptide repeat protein n=1 Tax=Streptomyces shenzhenensis TaxID=943815 RepID=A0A3M0HYD2_9ACTN|nr:tetratricopeptide repeat protein [Streptomyces shenzhenensis]RMB82261.1 hypothetical protein CTZ28_31000 [Streptomyces shenzhenensis]
MSRLSREEKRDEGRGVDPAARVDVRVSATGEATVDGVPLAAPPGREIQHAVLDHLQRLARTLGHPVQAAIHDTRIGYVVPLQVDTNGASHFTGDPARLTPKATAKASGKPGAAGEPGTPGEQADGSSAGSGHDSAAAAAEPAPYRDRPTPSLRPVVEPARDVAPAFPPRPVPEPTPHAEPAATFAPRPVTGVAPGTVQPPTGVFGPPPVMPVTPARPATPACPTDPPRPAEPPRSTGPIPVAVPRPAGTPGADGTTGSAPDWVAQAAVSGAAPTTVLPVPEPPRAPRPLVADFPAGTDPDPRPTPARGFDAVAEAVLGDGDDGGAALGEPTARINEAVRAGRIDAAAELAKRTVETAAADLGPDHPDVLRLRELTAYIAYLSGDPLHAFQLSLDLARLRRSGRDAEAAYGNVQSAAAAWRAVRDPEQGLSLGRDLIALWTELTAEEGPAADDIEELESARARMVRLTERAARAAG